MPPKKDTTKDTRASKSKESKDKEISETNESNETSETTETTKRAPTAYNVFMKTELPKVKAENPGMNHKEAFKLAAGNWKDSPNNPKNKTG
ncbi:hypothetical protein RclHR1_02530003 [Rhizophagus clarus]|uniref:Axial regulator YABBY 4 n=1 Tax=Rhizophagus clarus TaxID=94130 RepID=A0A2Z6RTX1_9GLOM|nr:hypothetical protein RclHR1_02530003 [Rhizophagus clarus]GES75644.1 axial regulator YABBY 4 [Rhizophagus clarus]